METLTLLSITPENVAMLEKLCTDARRGITTEIPATIEDVYSSNMGYYKRVSIIQK
jgi:hypothetical protein